VVQIAEVAAGAGMCASFLTDPSWPGISARLPEKPRTLGEHLKRARLDRGMEQKETARAIGCDPGTLGN